MSELTPDRKLAALFAEQTAPPRDPLFCAEVMARVARRRAWARVGAASPLAVSCGLATWALQPVLQAPVESLGQALALPAAILGATAVLIIGALTVARRLGAWASLRAAS